MTLPGIRVWGPGVSKGWWVGSVEDVAAPGLRSGYPNYQRERVAQKHAHMRGHTQVHACLAKAQETTCIILVSPSCCWCVTADWSAAGRGWGEVKNTGVLLHIFTPIPVSLYIPKQQRKHAGVATCCSVLEMNRQGWLGCCMAAIPITAVGNTQKRLPPGRI